LKLTLESARDAYSVLEAILNFSDENYLRQVFWSPNDKSWRVHAAPIEVKTLTAELFSDLHGVFLTSATLSAGPNIQFILERIGLKTTEPLQVLPSPFNLAEQEKILIPKDLAPPGSDEHFYKLLEIVADTAYALKGRTMLLMTSNQRLKKAAELLRAQLEPHGITVFDSLSENRAVENFKATEHALLIGSERLGEGVDIPGKQLSCVILEKINEAMTRGPLAEARKSRVKNSLFGYDFPLRMIWLKQRAGRLIRSKTDHGVVIVCDPRYHAWSPSSQRVVQQTLAPAPIFGGTWAELKEKYVRPL
jgi:ATP-dependent DNA helicase DinG